MTVENGSTDSQNRQELPEGWHWVKLDEVCKLNPRRTLDDRENEASTSFVPMELVDARSGAIAEPRIRKYSEVKKGYTFFVEGDILFAKITPCMQNGKHAIACGLIAGIGFGSTEFHVLRPSPEVIPEWIHFFIRQPTLLQEAAEHFTGAVGQQRLPEDYLANIEIPLPPLPEQQRIAALLKEQMAAVDKARAAAEERLAAIKALPAAFLRQVFPEPDQTLPDGWRWVKLGQVCRIVGGAQPPKSFFRYEPHVDYIRLVQIQDFRLSNVAVYIPKKMAVKTFDESDVMIGRYGPPVFQILRGLSGAYNVALMKTEPLSAVDKDYLYFILQWPNIQNDVKAQSQRAAGQSGVQKEFLENYIIPLPELSEQQRIATQLKEQFAAVEKARKAAEAELETINALPASLLRRAFNGEL